MKKFLERSLEFVAIVLVLNSFMEIKPQTICPTIDDILNKGWQYNPNDPHNPDPHNNRDEIGVINESPFLVKVDDYPPIVSFPIADPNNILCNDPVWYVSFDSDDATVGPIPYIVWNPILPD